MVELAIPMLADWLGTYLLHSTALLGGAWLASRLLRGRAPALQAHLWRAALIGALVSATAQGSGLVQRLSIADLALPAAQVVAPAAAEPAAAVPHLAPRALPAARPAPQLAAPRAEAKPVAA